MALSRMRRSSRFWAGVRSMAARTPSRVRLCCATMTFSKAVIFWNSRMFWKVRATPSARILCGRRAASGLPS